MFRTLFAALLFLPTATQAETTEFCLDGEFDLGARNQALTPGSQQWYPTTWCVITEDDGPRVAFAARGMANADMEDRWTVAYPAPDLVRIVNRDDPPDIEFAGADAAQDALRIRRLDPRRLLSEFAADPEALTDLTVEGSDETRLLVETRADVPLRGSVPVVWRWDFTQTDAPRFELELDGEPLLRGTGRWRTLDDNEAEAVWERTPGEDPVQVPGEVWPSAVRTELINLTEDVYIARGVRSGFQHIIVETDEGLVIGDAPAGWVEFHQLPPADLVPGLGISGLSEQFVDFLAAEFPGRGIHAVAITHAHDDHAGGARAFAAAGAKVYAPRAVADFLETTMNTGESGRFAYVADRLAHRSLEIVPVDDSMDIGNGVRLLSMGSSPHASANLGVWATERDYFFVSDIHVPYDDSPTPREGRERTECWFAEWAVANLPPEVRIINSHSSVVTPVSRLAEYLESDGCRNLSN